jgi:hypothetical protein
MQFLTVTKTDAYLMMGEQTLSVKVLQAAIRSFFHSGLSCLVVQNQHLMHTIQPILQKLVQNTPALIGRSALNGVVRPHKPFRHFGTPVNGSIKKWYKRRESSFLSCTLSGNRTIVAVVGLAPE